MSGATGFQRPSETTFRCGIGNISAVRLQPRRLDESILVEVQGEFQLTREYMAVRGANRGYIKIGDLSVKIHMGPDGKETKATAKIEMGDNTLEGKIETLKKPLLVIRKIHQQDSLVGTPAHTTGREIDQHLLRKCVDASTSKILKKGSQFGSIGPVSHVNGINSPKRPSGKGYVLSVSAIIRRKITFGTRPSIHVPPHLVKRPTQVKKK